jgi:hypothetical protein
MDPPPTGLQPDIGVGGFELGGFEQSCAITVPRAEAPSQNRKNYLKQMVDAPDSF